MIKSQEKSSIKVAIICLFIVFGLGLAMVGTVWTASYLFHLADVQVKEHIQAEEE